MKKYLLPILLITFWSCEEDNEEPQSDTLVIEVNEETGGNIDPYVFFSPSTGEIIAATSDDRPEEKYIYFIQPSDPEFQNLDYGKCFEYFNGEPCPECDICKDCYQNGMKFIGNGTNYFEETTISSGGCLKNNLLYVGLDTIPSSSDYSIIVDNVYFIKEGNDSCLIQILDWVQYEPSPSLTFKWKKLE